MRELWTGRVELLTPPTEWGDTKCFTNVFAWADGPEDFATIIDRNLKSEGIAVLNIEEAHPVEGDEVFPEKTQPFLDWVREHLDGFTTADRHYYPSRPA